MNKHLGMLVAATTLLTLLAAPAQADDPAVSTEPQAPTRILITGDSITQAYHGDYSWRSRLWHEFQRQSVRVDFVGSRTSPYGADGVARYALADFDQDHFAFAGTTLEQQSGWIGPEVATQHPDLVVLASGVNDLRHGYSVAQTQDHLRAWMRAVRDVAPTTPVVVSTVLGARSTMRADLAAQIATYDAELPGLLQEMSSPEGPVTLSDTVSGWDVDAFTVDDLHPTPAGEIHIAQSIATTLHALGILPEQPEVGGPLRWTRVDAVKVTLSGSRSATWATLTWPTHSITGARVYIRRIGGSSVISPFAYRGGRKLLAVAAGASYDVRVQLVRGRLVGPWGPATRVKVPAHR